MTNSQGTFFESSRPSTLGDPYGIVISYSDEIDDMGVVIDKKCMHLQKVDDTFMGKFIISGDEILVGKFELDNPKNMKVMIKYKVRK